MVVCEDEGEGGSWYVLIVSEGKGRDAGRLCVESAGGISWSGLFERCEIDGLVLEKEKEAVALFCQRKLGLGTLLVI